MNPNPFLAVLNDSGISAQSQGSEQGAAFLALSLGKSLYSGSFTVGNPWSEVKRLLLLAGGRSNGYQQIEQFLTFGEQRWASR